MTASAHTGPLLLLASPSRESHDKARRFSASAATLGLPVQTVVSDTPSALASQIGAADWCFVLPCSDALAVTAAHANAQCRAGGLAPHLAMALADKASGIPLLSRMLDLPVLPQLVPQDVAAMRDWPYRGPVFVKPTRSSGGWSQQPWGYRRYESAAAFLRFLEDSSHVTDFFAGQRQPGALGPFMLQAAIDSNRIEAAALLLTATRLQVVGRSFGDFEAENVTGAGRRWHRIGYHDDAASVLAAALPRLALQRRRDAGWGRGLIYLQGLAGPDGFHLIDINLRLSTALHWLVGGSDPDWHTHLLASLLFDTPFTRLLAAPACAIDLVHGDPWRRIAAIDHPPLPPHILPLRLTPQDCAVANLGFDQSSAAPAFVTLADSMDDCIARADAFRASLRVTYADAAAA